ncbi:DUF885 family protein [Marinicella litoralis]|uniref:Uncharacterized protein DUF885 n=1 Tax=Marinicella litoralis TaxID=644220 RepID=A0A4V3DIL4_9GAMM|nr:DUF885 family protein [Marinicella litoralis]TDR22591.1 uncharacterized protein DUF885 [Marinicella litoralis]
MTSKILFMVLLMIPLGAKSSSDFSQLEALFIQWRAFEVAPLHELAPDYRQQTFDKRRATWADFKTQLLAMDKSTWTVPQQVDWFVVLAELNGYEFNDQVLKPWARDPAFYKQVWTYQSDVPAHEGPTPHYVTELWTYQFPLSTSAQIRLNKDLSRIKPLQSQARLNLTGNAKELWIAGIRDIQSQHKVLIDLTPQIENAQNPTLSKTHQQAIQSTAEFIEWLQAQSPSKTGPSGLGVDQYTWYQQHVHMLPMTWADEERLLRRELDRAWSSLKLEEQRNKDLPALQAAKNAAEYDQLANRSAEYFLKFLDDKNIVTVADYFKPALYARLGSFVPEKTRNFFYIGSHLDPTPLYSHFYHWFELAIMEHDPNPSIIRKNALLYNIFDSRNEGTATAVEEIFMHAGLYDHNPRTREIVYIMLAQRAARGLGSLYAHANQMTMEKAGEIHMNYTPRGWMKTEPDLLLFEQHLYLRQPGYGTSYVTGKALLDTAMAQKAKLDEEQGKEFVLKDFFDQLNSMGAIPIALGTWEMTGIKPDFLDEVEAAARNQ